MPKSLGAFTPVARRARLGIAANLAAATPGKNVLFVVMELCTLSFRLDELTKANFVATALFGDGAAACILRADVHDLEPNQECGLNSHPQLGDGERLGIRW